MGSVYEAIDERFNSIVALKQSILDEDTTGEAFKREARLLHHLRHPALPRVTDYFLDAAGQFLVMDYIPGDDLETMRTRQNRPMPLPDVLHWADQLLDALHYLHTHQPPIIHRDLKPANLKLHGQQMMLLDFGIAKGTVANQSLASARSQFAYTLAYAPLEQIQGTGTTPRSDLYALDDRTVRLWNASNGTLLQTLQGHGGKVRGVAFSPDGTLLASGSEDRTIRLWGTHME